MYEVEKRFSGFFFGKAAIYFCPVFEVPSWILMVISTLSVFFGIYLLHVTFFGEIGKISQRNPSMCKAFSVYYHSACGWGEMMPDSQYTGAYLYMSYPKLGTDDVRARQSGREAWLAEEYQEHGGRLGLSPCWRAISSLTFCKCLSFPETPK